MIACGRLIRVRRARSDCYIRMQHPICCKEMNRVNACLTQIDDGLWCLESHFVMWGCKGSIRMTVISTGAGLIVYSPVAMTSRHIDQITMIGNVSSIIAPNLFHHFFLRSCVAAFPQARVLVPSGLEAKIGPVRGAQVISNELLAGLWDDVDYFIFSGHRLRECILFHRPSRTLVTADLLYNLQREHFAAEKLFFRSIACYGAPKVAFYHRFAIEDKASARAMVEKVRGWPVGRIVMSHGRIFTDESAGARLITAWAGLV